MRGRSPPSCKAVGISLDYTPVLDILTNPKNPVIGDRALAERAEDVARLGRAIITTLQAAGIAACGKHFPGHGDTSTDSHHELPLIEHPPDRLEAVELVPFKAAIEADVASIMTAHILIPALDEERPATLSPRDRRRPAEADSSGIGGLVLSDDLEMKAISARYGIPEATVAAIAAGCDAVLMCGASQEPQVAALEAVIHAVEDGTLPLKRVEDALARHRRVKERFLAPRAAAAADRRGAARRARPRRAPGGRRRDGEVRLVTACASPARCGQAIASPSSPPPARSPRDEFDAGVAELRRSASSRSTTTSVFDAPALPRRARAEVRAARVSARRGRTRRSPRSSPRAAATAAFSCCRCSTRRPSRRHAKAFIGYSDNTSILTWLDLASAASSSFHGPMIEGRLARGAAGYDRDTFVRCLCRAEPAGEITHPQRRELIGRAKRAGMLRRRHADAAHRVARHAVRLRSARRAASCSSTKSRERPYRIDRMLTQLRLSGILGARLGARLRRAAALRRARRRSHRPRGRRRR